MESNEFMSFVFLDGNSRPYAVMMLDGAPWLCYWNEGCKGFTTMRPVTQGEIFAFASKKLLDEQADLYFNYRKKAGEGNETDRCSNCYLFERM